VVTRGYTQTMVTNVRGAKARLSELLDRAARGEEIVITSDGKPKARLVAIEAGARPYKVHRELLRVGRNKTGASADVIVRQERDSRD
jgi:prevent-host-death family protein